MRALAGCALVLLSSTVAIGQPLPADKIVRLATVEPGHATADLAAVRALVGEAKIVAVGEVTHGAHEIALLQRRVVELLVEEMGFTAVALEAPLPETRDVDRWVQGGAGDPVETLAGLYSWPLQTEETLDLLRWLRRWNGDPRHQRVHVYGFDMQQPPRALRVALAALRPVDAEEAGRLAVALDPLADLLGIRTLGLLPAERKRALADAGHALVAALEARHAAIRTVTSEEGFAIARQHAVLVDQFATGLVGGLSRDEAMARNVDWIRTQSDGRVVVLAHDGHVAAGAAPSMGSFLRRAHGRDYVAIGTAFGEGSFRAMEVGRAVDGTKTFHLDPPPAGSVDAHLLATGADSLFLDLRSASPWWRTPHKTQVVGASYADRLAADYVVEFAPALAYDGLLFAAHTTASHALPHLYPTPPTVNATPIDLDFEAAHDDVLPGWTRFDGASDLAWRVGPTSAAPHGGKRAALVEHRAGHAVGELPGLVHQFVDAAPWRGKNVRLVAWLRVDGDASARVWIAAAREATGAALAMAASPLTTRYPWRRVDLLVDVPRDTSVLEVGLSVVGEGRAALDDVEVSAAR